MNPPTHDGPAGPGDDWDDHWSDFTEANERNPAQAYRRDLCLFLTGRRGAPRRLLDIGSGNGELLAAAARRWPGVELAGLELSAVGVQKSLEKVPQARVRVCDLIAESEPRAEEKAWATHAICSEVLEHVDDPVMLMRHVGGWLAPGCRLIVTVPGGPMSGFDRGIGHRRHFSPSDLRRVLEDAGLQPVLLVGAGFPFFNLYRGLVIARGEKLLSDASVDNRQTPQAMIVRAGMSLFRPLLSVSLPRSPIGWQTVAVARMPGPDASSGAGAGGEHGEHVEADR